MWHDHDWSRWRHGSLGPNRRQRRWLWHGRGCAGACGRAVLLNKSRWCWVGSRAQHGRRVCATVGGNDDDHQHSTAWHDDSPAAPSCGGDFVSDRPANTAIHVLLVEDHVQLRKVLKQTLCGEGFRVTTAESADQALSILGRGEAVDILFSDVRMPGRLDGLQLAR